MIKVSAILDTSMFIELPYKQAFTGVSPMSALFQSYKFKDVSLRNRIAIPPMCQYTAEDGGDCRAGRQHGAHSICSQRSS
ncbi:MAG: hypothetical protein CPDRYMAC_1087 [uncultured Paraburkholderia sp.]|nr:MAG: hypothetical protein CPDRYDRY_1063 [uncultured Paraburkholderia sp.]CAH2915837.1 MAG: hypothetical protein CPDRYMAC_1087 [uncultured Paraburkholderia sp.]